MLPAFPGLELALSSELAEVIHGGLEQWGQLIHGQEMHRALHTRLQIEIEGLFHRESGEVHQRTIIAKMRLLKGLDVTWTPFSEDQCGWVAILHEHQIEEQASHPPIAIREGMHSLKVV